MTKVLQAWTNIGVYDNGRFHLKYQMWADPADVANNRTYVWRRLLLHVDEYGSLSAGSYAYSGTGMTSASGGSVSFGEGDHVLLSSEGYVSHNADGTWSQAVSGSANFGNYYVWSCSGTAELETIPRASVPSVSPKNINIGASTTVYTNRASTSFTHTVTAKFGSSSMVHSIATNVGDSCTFNSNNFVSALVSAQTSGKVTVMFTVTTYQGSTQIGEPQQSSLILSINPSVPTVDKSSITIGETVTLSTNRTTSSRTHTVVASIGSTELQNQTGIGASTTLNTNTSTIKSKIMSAIGVSGKSGKITFTVTTFVNSVSIGSKTVSVTANVNTSAYRPRITFGTLSDTNSVSVNYHGENEMIRSLSNISLPVSFDTTSIYSELASAKITFAGSTHTETLSGRTGSYTLTANAVTTNVVSVSVTDKRGTTVTASKSFTLLGYINPVLSNSSVSRTDMTGSEAVYAVSGKAYAGTYTGSSTLTNSVTLAYRYKEVGGSWAISFTTLRTASLSGTGNKSWSLSGTFPNAFDYTKQYDIQFRIRDGFGEATQTFVTLRLYNGTPIVGWGETHFDVYGDLHLHERNEPSIVTHISTQNFVNRIHGFADGGENLGIFACVSSWLKHNSELYYHNYGNPNSFNRVSGVNSMVTEYDPTTLSDGKFPLDCMSFVGMCLMGIGFEQSIFGDKTNRPRYAKSPINFMSDDVCRFIKYLANGNTRAFPENATWERVLSWQFAMYCNSVGMYHHIDMPTTASSDDELKKARIDVMKGLKAGDILFEGDPGNSSYNKRFESIFHIVIYIGNTRFGDPLVAECSSDGSYPVKVRWRSISNFKLVGYARIPVGNNTIQSVYDYCAISNAPHAVEQVAMLNRPVQNWDTFKVTVACTYKTASIIGSVFPAIKIGSYVYSRYDENNMPTPTVEVPMMLDMYVCASPILSAVGNNVQTLTACFYGSTTPTSSQAHIEIVSVKSIVSAEQVGTKDVFIPSTVGSSANTISEFVTAVANYLSDLAVNNFACTFRTAYSGNAYDGYFAKKSSNNILVVLSNLARHGVVYDKTDGTATTTTYSSNAMDWNLASLTLR